MQIQLLDHGYANFIESWGSDERVIEAARMSTGKGFLGWEPGPCPVCGGSGHLRAPDEKEESDLGVDPCHGCDGLGQVKGDKKLLAYLWNNHHSTPFEMAGMTIVVQAPIMVFREWHRHRTQCLAGDTMICCVTPVGTSFKRSIRSIFDLKHGGVIDKGPLMHKNGTSKVGTPVFRDASKRRGNAWRIRVLPNCQHRSLRVLNESIGKFEVAQMSSVWESGIKQLFEITTSSGRKIKTTSEHPFFTPDGWVKLKDLKSGMKLARMSKVAAQDRPIPPRLRQGIGVWTSMMRSRLIRNPDNCYICGDGFSIDELVLDHVVPVSQDLRLALDDRNLKPACRDCHQAKISREQPCRVGRSRRGIHWDAITNIIPLGKEMTYDIEVNGSHHNYVANDFVVHNSYNEMSARYIPLPNLNYIPTVERLMMNSKTNKQAGTIAGVQEMTETEANVERTYLAEDYRRAEESYQRALAQGVPKELARLRLPVGRYSRMMASANLRNWLAFLTLRMDLKAQYEIRVYANAVGEFISQKFPRTWELFCQPKK